MRISPLLLKNVALRMGNLQVLKISRSGGSCVLGLWYVTGWGIVTMFSFIPLCINFWNMWLKFYCCWSLMVSNNVLWLLVAFVPIYWSCWCWKQFSAANYYLLYCWIDSTLILFMKFLKSSVMLRLRFTLIKIFE